MLVVKNNKVIITKPKYNHICKEFGDNVDDAFLNLDILKYYPYGSETKWSYWLCGHVNLKKEYLIERNKKKTEYQLVFSIIEGTATAMNYLMVHGATDGFDRQRIEAFALWKLFHSGDTGWSKKPLKGLDWDQQKKLFWKGQRDGALLCGDMARIERIKKDKKIEEAWFNSSLRNYGVYEVRHKPLMQYSNTTDTPKIFYTKQQLCAIDLMVSCAFENLC